MSYFSGADAAPPFSTELCPVLVLVPVVVNKGRAWPHPPLAAILRQRGGGHWLAPPNVHLHPLSFRRKRAGCCLIDTRIHRRREWGVVCVCVCVALAQFAMPKYV